LKYLFPLFQWHACKLAKLSACIAKCMTTINKIYIFFYIWKEEITLESLTHNCFITKENCKKKIIAPVFLCNFSKLYGYVLENCRISEKRNIRPKILKYWQEIQMGWKSPVRNCPKIWVYLMRYSSFP